MALSVKQPLSPATSVFTADGTYTFPSGVTKVRAYLWGGGGKNGTQVGGGQGGAGAYLAVDIPRGSRTTLTVNLNKGGGSAGPISAGGFGGGYSSITTIADGIIAIAGGGGGSGGGYWGGGGGFYDGSQGGNNSQPGTVSTANNYSHGGGGSQTTGGSAGVSPFNAGFINGTAGSYLTGGGAGGSGYGGGGGGGYYGGGGGGGDANVAPYTGMGAGGGGSSYISAVATLIEGQAGPNGASGGVNPGGRSSGYYISPYGASNQNGLVVIVPYLPAQQIPPQMRYVLYPTSINTTFSYTGADQSFIVPANVTTLVVKMWGAAGGGNGSSKGGGGAYVEGLLSVTPGETLTLIVGSGGAVFNTANNYGGGGGSATKRGSGAQGGGRSAIRRGGTEIVTAGGGGGGDGSANLSGGAATVDSQSFAGDASTGYQIQSSAVQGSGSGGGGYSTGGGANGSWPNPRGPAGQFQGGTGGDDASAGGGGGGYWGGGGGGYSGAGGGGSSYLAGIINTNSQSANRETPGNASSPLRGTAGQGSAGSAGGNGLIILATPNFPTTLPNMIWKTLWQPTQVPNLQLWVDSSIPIPATGRNTIVMSGGTVTQWTDKTSNALNFTGSASLGTGVNYRSVYFGGSMNSGISLTYNQSTAFLVCRPITLGLDASSYILAQGNQDFALRITNGAFNNPGNTNDWGYDPGSGTNSTYVNGTSVATSSPSILGTTAIVSSTVGKSFSGLQINGGFNSRTFTGHMFELLIYSSVPTTFQRQQIEGYFAWKWNIVGNLPSNHPYKNSPP